MYVLYMKMPNIHLEKMPEVFECEFCDYICSKNSDWERHVSRPKHKNNEKWYKNTQNDTVKTPKNSDCLCNCGKLYKHSTGLWRHKKKCKFDDILVNIQHVNDGIDSKMIFQIIQQNEEFKTLLLEQNQELQKQNQEAQQEAQKQNQELQKQNQEAQQEAPKQNQEAQQEAQKQTQELQKQMLEQNGKLLEMLQKLC